jgi:hypothetical protein
MNTAMQTREVLSKFEGVLRVHPFGHNGKAYVFVAAETKFSEEAANEALLKGTSVNGVPMSVRKMKRVKEATS